jgi:cytochrome c oxidase subunit 2
MRRAVIGFGTIAIAVVLSGCTANEAFFFDLPDPATQEGFIVQNLWQGSWIAAWIVGAFTWALMLFASVAYRRKKRQGIPAQVKYNMPIEILYTVVPLIMVLGLFWFTAKDQSELMTLKNDQQHTVGVVGYRWSWGFNYLDEKVWETGLPQGENMVGAEPVLWLPVNEKVRFNLNSPDVIHSFWVPNFLFKMDVIPGKTNAFELTPNKVGTFVGKCAELCGVNHSQMLFNVKVVDRATFDAHMLELKAKGQTGTFNSEPFSNKGTMPGERTV